MHCVCGCIDRQSNKIRISTPLWLATFLLFVASATPVFGYTIKVRESVPLRFGAFYAASEGTVTIDSTGRTRGGGVVLVGPIGDSGPGIYTVECAASNVSENCLNLPYAVNFVGDTLGGGMSVNYVKYSSGTLVGISSTFKVGGTLHVPPVIPSRGSYNGIFTVVVTVSYQ